MLIITARIEWNILSSSPESSESVSQSIIVGVGDSGILLLMRGKSILKVSILRPQPLFF
jgi:hypothetical protein